MGTDDTVEKESYDLHRKAWSDQSHWQQHLEGALAILKPHIDSGEGTDTTTNNYAAVLLDLNRNSAALDFLQENLISTESCHANMAIAIAKTTLTDIDNIRKFNKSASELPQTPYSITAYMDWQAL